MASGNGKFGCNVSPEERVRNNATSGGQSVKIYPDLTQFQEATQNGSTSDRIAETCVLNITKLQANKGSFSWCFLVELGIEQYLWKQNVYTQGLKVEADNKEIRFTNTKHENERIITLIEEFLTSMQVISVSDIYNLQILQNRNTNEKLLDFLRTHIDVIPHTHVVLHSDEKEVFFGCKDEQSLRIFVSNLQNVVFKREFNIADGECREMIKALQMSGQLYILCSDQETEHMLCTQPVIKQLDEHMQCIFQVRLLPLQVEYFASFGKIKVQELGLENGLQIDLNKGNKTLTFRGKRCDIKAMDDRLKTYFQLKKIKIALPRNILPTFEGTAMAAVSEQQCCYSINWRPSAEKGPGNRLIASWKSKDGNGVTLIQGRLFDLDVDAVVILANTSMSPRTTIAEEDIVTQFKDVNVMLKKIPTKLGKVFEVGDEKNQRSYIAITDSSSATSLDEPICYQVLKVHLERLRRKGCQSVAIHASVFPETHVCTKDITNWFIKASLEVPEMSYYLCADNKDDLGQIAEDVRLNCLSSKPSHNYLRQTFAVDVVFGEPRMLEVHIRNGTLIADQKADIIVNTTGKSLQLEKGGALSRSIVLAAGVQLQDELSKEYPGGLNEGQIAVTSSGKLSRNGVHEIIHCVLPKFDKEKFDDDIKAMVKTCLAEADKLQGKSIALPPFGTGRHGYPIRETALAMFEAIDEFSEESVGMTLQTIYIPTLEDEHCKAFISAQSKRSSSPDRKKINNENMVDFYKHIGNGQYSLRVCVGNIFLLKFLPRSTLHVYFAVGAGEQGLNWEEKKDNDYTWIGISDEISHIVHAVETVLDACIEKMITDVALFSPVQQLDREDFTDVQFVQTVIRAFERDPAKLRYLRSALILLASGTNIASLEKMLCGTKMNTLRTYVGNSSFVGMPWVKPPDPAVEMCVYGAGEKTSIALGNIEQITSSPHSFGKETETKKELDLGTNVDDDYDVIEEIQTKQTVCETPKKPLIDAEEVRLTATINQGIVKYLQSHEALDAWSIDVQKCFGISLQSSDNCIKVQGRCRNVSMFENYLQNFFPNEPDYAKGQMELAYSGLSFDDRHFADVSNDGSYSELIAKTDFKSSEVDCGDFFITISVGDIVKSNDDFIISPSDALISNSNGVACALAKVGGNDYQRECKNAAKTQLQPGECCVTGAGNLKCKKVIHAFLPYKEKFGTQDSLEFENILLSCFEISNSFGAGAIAVPALGTGLLHRLSSKQSGQIIAEAIKRFKPITRKLQNVHIVLKDDAIADEMNRVFCDIQSSKQWPISDKVAPVKITQYVSVSVVVGVTTHGQVVFTNKSTYQRPKENTQERMSQKILDPSPKWNPEKEIDIREFKKRIMDKTKLIIEAGVEQRSSIINLPLIGESGNEAKFPTPLRFCALAISEGLKRVCSRVPKPMTVQINTSSKLQANIIYETVKSFNWNTQADVGWTYWGQIGLPTIV